MSLKDISQTIALLYQTLEQPAMWPAAMNAVTEVLNADHALLGDHDSECRDNFLISTRIADDHLSNFVQFNGDNPLQELATRGPTGCSIITGNMIPIEHEYYQQVVRPMGGHYGLAAVPFRTRQVNTFFVACRPKKQNNFHAEEKSKLDTIIPHITNILQLRKRLLRNDEKTWQQEQLLEKLQAGVILIDRNLRLCWKNQRAARFLELNDGIFIDRDRVHAKTYAQNQNLQTALYNMSQGKNTGLCNFLSINRTSGKPPFIVRIIPLQHSEQFFPTDPQVAFGLFIDTLENNTITSAHLVECFGFTAREAELAALLIQGHTLSASADYMQMGIETARWHLDNLFGKTHTHKQGELISFLLRSVWRL